MKRSSKYDSAGPRVGDDGPPARISPVGGMFGAALGGGVAGIAAGLELLFREALDLGVSGPDSAVQVTVASVAAGVVIGGLGGLAGFGGPTGLVVYGFGWLGWTVGTIAARDAEGLVAMAIASGVAAGFLLLGVAASRIPVERLRVGVGVGAWTLAVLAGVPIAGLVGSPRWWEAFAIAGIVSPLAVVAGGLGGFLLGRAGLVRVVLLLSAVAAMVWSAALPLARQARPPLAAATRGERPVVVIAIDGLRADHLGRCSHGRDPMPGLSARARRGFRYDEAWATSTWALPALGSLLTGRWPSRHGAGASHGEMGGNGPLRTNIPTLALDLARGQVASAAVFSSRYGASRFGLDRGFLLVDPPPPPPLAAWALADLAPLGLRRSRTAWEAADAAQGVLRRRAAGFLFVEIADVISDEAPDPADVAAMGGGADDATWLDAKLAGVDRQLGALLHAVPPDAVVIVVGTHAWAFSRAGQEQPAFGGVPEADAVHVALVVLGKGVGASRRPVSTVDVPVTVAALLQVEALAGADGQLLAEIFGRTGEPRVRVAEAVQVGEERQIADDGRWRVMRGRGGSSVYDLSADPRGIAAAAITQADASDARRRLEAALPPVGGADIDGGGTFADTQRAWALRARRPR